ncbi:MAG: IS110 family transposase [Candidatus Acidiferrales bacterium]
MDASSIEVPRRRRWAKTDAIDAGKLLDLLVGEARGDRRYKRVHVPSEADEAARRLHRERETLLAERGRYRNRLQGLLTTHGVRAKLNRQFGARLEKLTNWRGEALAVAWVEEFERLWTRLQLVDAQLKILERAQAQTLANGTSRQAQQMRQLQQLCGLDQQIPWVLVHEFFGWRAFQNGREIGKLAGLTATPFASGELRRELGIGKDGNRRVRWIAVELAWLWVRYQPDSELTQWFMRRFAHAGKRQRRVGIVAVARKLLVALWRYLETGVLPAGARVKA